MCKTRFTTLARRAQKDGAHVDNEPWSEVLRAWPDRVHLRLDGKADDDKYDDLIMIIEMSHMMCIEKKKKYRVFIGLIFNVEPILLFWFDYLDCFMIILIIFPIIQGHLPCYFIDFISLDKTFQFCFKYFLYLCYA